MRKGNLNLTGGSKPHYDTLFSSSDQSLITSALDENATLEQKSNAVMALFNTANASRKNTPVTLMLQDSNAGIAAADIVMHGFNLRSGDKFYYQLVAEAHADDEFLNTLYAAIAGLAKVAYSKGDGNYWYTTVMGAISNPYCKVETFPYATFDVTKAPDCYDAESFKEMLHYIDSFHEVVNMEFCAEILKDIEITYNADEGYYHVEFSVDMAANQQLISKWYAMVKKDVEVSGQTIKKYNYY
ncbi:MAG: hypothetical protein K2M36_04815, partial [Clostridia bacterium]|nr:hypothetical protein [Clostridia bacterium]